MITSGFIWTSTALATGGQGEKHDQWSYEALYGRVLPWQPEDGERNMTNDHTRLYMDEYCPGNRRTGRETWPMIIPGFIWTSTALATGGRGEKHDQWSHQALYGRVLPWQPEDGERNTTNDHIRLYMDDSSRQPEDGERNMTNDHIRLNMDDSSPGNQRTMGRETWPMITSVFISTTPPPATRGWGEKHDQRSHQALYGRVLPWQPEDGERNMTNDHTRLYMDDSSPATRGWGEKHDQWSHQYLYRRLLPRQPEDGERNMTNDHIRLNMDEYCPGNRRMGTHQNLQILYTPITYQSRHSRVAQ